MGQIFWEFMGQGHKWHNIYIYLVHAGMWHSLYWVGWVGEWKCLHMAASLTISCFGCWWLGLHTSLVLVGVDIGLPLVVGRRGGGQVVEICAARIMLGATEIA